MTGPRPGFGAIGHPFASALAAAADFRRAQQLFELRADGLDDIAAQAELDRFTAWARTVPMSAERAWAVWRARNPDVLMFALTASSERFRAALQAAAAAIQNLADYLRNHPCTQRTCFCHSKPFPAARDYRRRTRHRNRRRR